MCFLAVSSLTSHLAEFANSLGNDEPRSFWHLAGGTRCPVLAGFTVGTPGLFLSVAFLANLLVLLCFAVAIRVESGFSLSHRRSVSVLVI